MQDTTGVSQRLACRLVGISRSTLHYRSDKRDEDAQLKEQLSELAHERRRFGYRRLHALLRRSGLEVNHKRQELKFLQRKQQYLAIHAATSL